MLVTGHSTSWMVCSSLPSYRSVRLTDSKPLVRLRSHQRRTSIETASTRTVSNASCAVPVMPAQTLYSAMLMRLAMNPGPVLSPRAEGV